MARSPVDREATGGLADDGGLGCERERVPVVDGDDPGALERQVLDAPVDVTDHDLAVVASAALVGGASEVVDPLGAGGRRFEVEPQVMRSRPERIVG